MRNPDVVMRKQQTSKLRDILPKSYTVFFNTVRVEEGKEILRNWSRLKETKKARQPNVECDFGLVRGGAGKIFG